MGGKNVCHKADPKGLSWRDCTCNSCRSRQHAAEARAFKEARRDSKSQDSRSVHDTKGRNTHGRTSW